MPDSQTCGSSTFSIPLILPESQYITPLPPRRSAKITVSGSYLYSPYKPPANDSSPAIIVYLSQGHHYARPRPSSYGFAYRQRRPRPDRASSHVPRGDSRVVRRVCRLGRPARLARASSHRPLSLPTVRRRRRACLRRRLRQGANFPYLPSTVELVGTDISPEMLEKAHDRLAELDVGGRLGPDTVRYGTVSAEADRSPSTTTAWGSMTQLPSRLRRSHTPLPARYPITARRVGSVVYSRSARTGPRAAPGIAETPTA